MLCFAFFFFNDPATTEIYTLSLHDALPIWVRIKIHAPDGGEHRVNLFRRGVTVHDDEHDDLRSRRAADESPRSEHRRSEEHTSELQSQSNLVCRLLLEKKKNKKHRELEANE